MTVTVAKMKVHLSIDGDEYNDLLNDLIATAAEKATADCQGRYDNDDYAPYRYQMAVKLLVADWFLNREATTDGKRNKNPVGYEFLISGLRPGASYV